MVTNPIHSRQSPMLLVVNKIKNAFPLRIAHCARMDANTNKTGLELRNGYDRFCAPVGCFSEWHKLFFISVYWRFNGFS